MKVILCNCPVDKAERIASSLVEERFAACVNIIPSITSIYHWDGKICKDPESTLLVKIRKGDFPDVARRIKQLHPYDVPEIVELDVTNVNKPYLDWLTISTRRPQK